MLNNLINNKNNLLKTLDKLTISSNTSTFIDKDNLDFKIKELEIEKKKSDINKQINIIDSEIEKETNKISEEEYNNKINIINENYNNEINLIDQNIDLLNNQKNETNKYYFLDIKQKNQKSKIISSSKKINQLKNQNRSLQLKNQIQNLGSSAIVIILSNLINRQMMLLNEQITNMSNMVNNTNDLIDNINDEQSLKLATNARNNTLLKILDLESKIDNISKSINTISTIVNLLSIIVTTMQVIANTSPLPPVRTVAQNIINKLQPILLSLSVMLSVFNLSLNNILKDINRLKDNLKPIDPNNNSNLLLDDPSFYGKLGLLEGYEYKGFRFVIKEENNPQFQIKGIKRRYAVALNNDNNEVLKSSYSYTLDPAVLVEELKLTINQTDLKP